MRVFPIFRQGHHQMITSCLLLLCGVADRENGPSSSLGQVLINGALSEVGSVHPFGAEPQSNPSTSQEFAITVRMTVGPTRQMC